MTLSLRKIRYFIATADAGQVSHAGTHLGVSQSAITAAVQQLEAELGVALFSRHASITVLSDMVYRPWSLEGQRTDTRSVVGDIPTMDVGLAWPIGRPLSIVTRTFLDFMSMSFGGAGSALGHAS